VTEYQIIQHGTEETPAVYVDDKTIHVYGNVDVFFGNPFEVQLDSLMRELSDVAGDHDSIEGALFAVLVRGCLLYADAAKYGDDFDGVLQALHENLDPNYPPPPAPPTLECEACGATDETVRYVRDQDAPLCTKCVELSLEPEIGVRRYCNLHIEKLPTGAWTVVSDAKSSSVVCHARGKFAGVFLQSHAPTSSA